MRNLIDIMEGASWRHLWWFWYNPISKQLVEVDGTHATTAHYDMGFEAGEISEEGIDLEDEVAIKNAIDAGWVRGRYGNMLRTGMEPAGEWMKGGRQAPADLSLQGQKDLVLQAARDISERRRVNDLFLDFGTTGEMESFHLSGKTKNIYLQTGEIGAPLRPKPVAVEWVEMLGHQLRKAMSKDEDNFKLPFMKGSKFGDESHLTAWFGDRLVADAELQRSPSDPNEFWLMHITVHPEHQGNKYANMLASWAFQTTKKLSGKTLVISSFTDQGKERLEPRLRRIAHDYEGHLEVHFNSDGPRRTIQEAYGDDVVKFWIDPEGKTHMMEPGEHHIDVILNRLDTGWLQAFRTGWVRGFFETRDETMNYCFMEKKVTSAAIKEMLRMAREWKAVAFNLEEAITDSRIGGSELSPREFGQYIRSKSVAPAPLMETKHDGYQTWSTITDSYQGESFGYCQAERIDATGEKSPIGYINFSLYQGRAHVKMIEVNDNWKRKGVATALMKELAMLVDGDENVDWGEHTEDGMAFHVAYDRARRAGTLL